MENKISKGRVVVIVLIVFIILVLGIFAFLIYSGRGGAVGEAVRAVLPFGQGGEEREGGPVPVPGTGGGIIEGEGMETEQVLRKLHDAPVAGLYPFMRNNESGVFVRFMGRGLGHIYETSMVTNEKVRISNETRLKIYEALWGNGGNGVAIRYLSDDGNNSIRTYSITLRDIKNGTSTEEGRLVESEGVFLRENISEVTISKENGDRLFYVLPSESGSVGIITPFDGGRQTQIFSSPLKEWLPQWPKGSLLTLTTKPSAGVPGLFYFLDSHSGALTKILGGIPGLTTNTSPSGKYVLFSESTRGGFGTFLYDVSQGTRSPISINTLPDKCVWSVLQETVLYCGVPESIPSGEYPDLWYQGLVSFNDSLWVIDVETGNTTLLGKPRVIAGEEIDATQLVLDPTESFLFFLNKKDSAPWSFNLVSSDSSESGS